MIEIRPLERGDIEKVKSDPLEKAVKDYPDLIAPSDYCHTALWDGEVVGVGGVIIYWEGVGEVWILLSPKIRKFPIQMVRCIRKMYEKHSTDRSFRRLQCVVSIDFPQGQKMVESLGFEKEGLLRKYLPEGTDAWMYSIIRNGDGK